MRKMIYILRNPGNGCIERLPRMADRERSEERADIDGPR